jgi:hypothetical protein
MVESRQSINDIWYGHISPLMRHVSPLMIYEWTNVTLPYIINGLT